MNDYKAVPSGTMLSQRIVESLENVAHRKYQFDEWLRALQAVNDILQGRSARSADELLAEQEKYGKQTGPLLQDIRNFQRQKELLTQVYDKRWNGKRYVFERREGQDGHTLKVIDQKLYDRAAKSGFPPDFFRESYFDKVTFYCLPDYADFYNSELHGCKFAVCRVKGASFVGTHIYGSEFYTSVLNLADFFGATLAHTRFHDCELTHVMFNSARLKSCSTIDCTMDGINYSGAVLDGCSFVRVTVGTIRNLDGAVITQGGATEEECRRNREAIYQALGVKEAGCMSITATELKKDLEKGLALSSKEDICITRKGTMAAKPTNPFQDRVDIAKSLFGVLPADVTLEGAREERLGGYEE